jgi:PII-like signaling protein
VSTQALRLTVYFGERDRTPRGLLADELLRIYAQRRIQVSVLVRGSEGFGAAQRLRSDRLLSLSEDLPLAAVAVDTRERIEAALEQVLELTQRGLVTLERTLLLNEELGAPSLPSTPGEAAKLTVYLGRGERIGRLPAHVAVCELLHRRGLAGASVLAGVDGTRGGERTRARFFAANAAVPAMIVAVAPAAAIAEALAELRALSPGALMTLERLVICKRDGLLMSSPPELAASDQAAAARWQKLTVHCSQAATHAGRPLNLEIIRRLRAGDAAGATSVRGIWGFHGDHAPHGDRLFQLRRHVPVLTVAIDAPEQSAASFAIIDELTAEHGLVTAEMIPAPVTPTDHRGGAASRLGEPGG